VRAMDEVNEGFEKMVVMVELIQSAAATFS
jgi:hypothetical protein